MSSYFQSHVRLRDFQTLIPPFACTNPAIFQEADEKHIFYRAWHDSESITRYHSIMDSRDTEAYEKLQIGQKMDDFVLLLGNQVKDTFWIHGLSETQGKFKFRLLV